MAGSAPVSWQGLALPPTTFCADPNKVVVARASEHASEGSPGHDTRGKACLCDVHRKAHAFNTYSLTSPVIHCTLSISTCDMDAVMPRIAVDDNKRMNLRVRPEQKATLMRAAALKNTDLTDFVLQPALREAEAIIEAADHMKLSVRDSLQVLELLENPPAANARLRAAAEAMPSPA
jgi:uncharacterized protein (DUF1778 family)